MLYNFTSINPHNIWSYVTMKCLQCDDDSDNSSKRFVAGADYCLCEICLQDCIAVLAKSSREQGKTKPRIIAIKLG